MKRREFITLLGSAAAAWPLAVHGQQAAMPVIGYFSGRSPEAEAPIRVPFLKALEGSGFAVERKIAIEYRFAEGQDERLPVLAAELVRRQVAMLVATDPVQAGLVASLNRPGGNATGVSLFTAELGPKRLGLFRELLPKQGTIAFMVNANSASTPYQIQEMQSAAQAVGQPLLVVSVGTEEEVDKAFATMAERNVAGVLYGATLFFQVISARLVALAAHYRIPALYEWREFVTAGGLMSYSTDRNEVGREAGLYAGRILKGEKPADLPVVQSSRFEFVINLKTAKALGLDLALHLLQHADEVIE